MKRVRLLVAGTVLVVSGLGVWASAAAALPQIAADQFQPTTNCGCHSAFLEQWGESMHSKALTDPLYQYKLSEANAATDGELGAFCNTCHGPVATMSGEIADLANASPQSADAVGCVFCHHVTGTGQPIGNVSQTIEADGVMRAQLKDASSPFHPTEYSGFHETAEFCGSCHNVDHPVNGMHLEATYTEWKNGPYAAQGIVCQDCHMTPGPGVTKPYPGTAAAGGPQRDHIYVMTFAGGNVGLGDSVLAEERLKAAATLEVDAPQVLEAGASDNVVVTITNSGAGHYLPTGLTEVRQMWLEVTTTDAGGTSEVVGVHEFGSILEDAEGNAPVELWEAVDFASDDRIPPQESVTDTFEITMPDADQVEVTAALYYRSCSEEMAKEAGVEIPTTTMASTSLTVFSSADAQGAANGESPGSTALLAVALGGLLVVAGLIWVWVRSRAKKAEA